MITTVIELLNLNFMLVDKFSARRSRLWLNVCNHILSFELLVASRFWEPFQIFVWFRMFNCICDWFLQFLAEFEFSDTLNFLLLVLDLA